MPSFGSHVFSQAVSRRPGQLFTLVLLSLTAALPPAHAQNRFPRPLPSYPTGGAANTNPQILAKTDVNGDGKPDLIVLNPNGSTQTTQIVTLLRGDGKGGFLKPTTMLSLPVGDSVLTVGDFNDDGRMDLAVLASGGQVRIFLGASDDTFKPGPATTVCQCGLLGAAAGDVNKDGHLDLVIGAPSSNVYTLLGNGNGTFRAPINTNTSASGGPIALGDFNHDGRLDAAVSDGSFTFQVLVGNGDGTFVAGAVSDLPAIGQLLAADVDGDGNVDLVASVSSVRGFDLCTAGYVAVLPGSDDGTFGGPVSYSVGFDPFNIELSDLNGDGRPDIVAGNFSSNSVSVLLNAGKSGFQPAVNYTTGNNTSGYLGVADLNGDRRPDIALVESNQAIQVLLNQGGGRFLVARSIPTDINQPVALGSTDVNHDGISDLVLTSNPSCTSDPGSLVSILSNEGVGLSSSVFQRPNVTYLNHLGLGDVNHDGNVDAVVNRPGQFSGNGITSLNAGLNNGKGMFSFVQAETKVPDEPFVLGDWNRDGKSDLAVLDSGSNAVLIQLGNGDGSFASPRSYTVGAEPALITSRDVNHDGKLDILTANKGSDTLSVLLGNGDGTFQAAKDFPIGATPTAIVTADFNRDGIFDVAVGHESEVSILLGNGNGTFKAPQSFPAGGSVSALAAADLRGNSDVDLVNSSNGIFFVLSGDGRGAFGAPIQYAGGGGPALVTGDFNADGAPDLAFVGSLGVTVAYNQGGTRVTLTSSARTITLGQSVTFAATVAQTISGTGTPTGTVAFKNGTALLGRAVLNAGRASFSTTHLAKGTHTITAVYYGNSNFNSKTSPAVAVTVN
ncbi:MAG: FG-GAP-like repeat-containing protein [Acidobacteriaceae bacterium]